VRLTHVVLPALVVFGACAHTPDLGLRPDPAPPSGSTTETIAAADGTQLFARHWTATGDVHGVVVLMHGLKDHSARYADFAARLAAGGYSVYAFDLRGHGRSAGPRVAPDPWMDYVDDLDWFLTTVEGREAGKPVFLFGHSMGGAIAARTAEVHRPQLAGLVLSAPALVVDAPPLLIAATRMTGALMPKFPALKLDYGDFSSRPEARGEIDKDELISQPPAPARTAAGLVDGMRVIWRDADSLTMPVLALHGTKDRLTAPSGSRTLIARVPSADKTLRIYPGFFHDLLHEPRGSEVASDIHSWLDAHTGGAALPSTPPYEGELAGDPRGWTQAVELAGGISRDDADELHPAGQLAVMLARPRPIGWHGALTARLANGGYAVGLKPVGVALRAGGAVIGVAGGAALVTDARFAFAGGGWIAAPAGPLHVSLHADYERTFSGTERNSGQVLGSIRFGADRAYWPHARAGVGPLLSGGYECRGDACGLVALVGFDLYGAD
jgi:alpha-beta hydrolase superfamily lysophospholipase